MLNPVVAALAGAVRTRGSQPLLTWYRGDDRVEFSVRSFANWVDKTANLIESLDAAGGLIGGELSLVSPGSWMSLVWPLAAWQRDCGYSLSAGRFALSVIGPDDTRPRTGTITIACSLHPLGLGLRGLPGPVLDFSGEALGQPDVHVADEVDGAAPAWIDEARSITHAALAELPATGGRVLVRSGEAWPTLVASMISPLLGGGSAVLVDGGADADRLAAIAAAERTGA